MTTMARPTKLTPELLKQAREYIYKESTDSSVYPEPQWKYDDSIIPTIESFASYLLINRDTVYAWAKDNKEFSDIVDEIKNQQAIMLINGSLGNKYNATIAKLILSGKHGYVEKSETDVTTKGEAIGSVSPELAAGFTEFLKQQTKQ